jgi:bla regulator protein BlaR1
MNIADHLWQSTLFAAIVGLLNWTLRRNRARVRHGLWLAASAKFLIPFAVLIALGVHIPWSTPPRIAPSRLSAVVIAVSEPFSAPTAVGSPLPTVLLTIWAAGFLGIASSWLVRWRRIAAAVQAAGPVDMGVPMRAVSCSTVGEPGVFGIVRPVLLLPAGIGERLTPEQLQAVVTHELFHVRHRDNAFAAFQMFVETLFWFHPLVWWMGRRMGEERERACDEAVLCAGSEPRIYAEAILNVCKFYTESPLACVSGVTGANLKRRIEAIMSRNVGSELRSRQKLGLAIAAMAAVASPIVIGMAQAPVARAQSSAPAKSQDARQSGDAPMVIFPSYGANEPVSSPHAFITVYPGKSAVKLTVPLTTLSGQVDMIGQVTEILKSGASGRHVASVRDSVPAGPDAKRQQWQTTFILDPGSYSCRLLVREISGGQIYTKSIAFEVK